MRLFFNRLDFQRRGFGPLVEAFGNVWVDSRRRATDESRGVTILSSAREFRVHKQIAELAFSGATCEFAGVKRLIKAVLPTFSRFLLAFLAPFR